jgi:hypothetical protein
MEDSMRKREERKGVLKGLESFSKLMNAGKGMMGDGAGALSKTERGDLEGESRGMRTDRGRQPARVLKMIGSAVSSLAFMAGMAMPVMAEDGAISLPDVTNTDDVTESIGRIASLSLVIIRWVGAAVAVYGVFEFASAWGQHDSSQQTAAIKKIVSGMLMIIIQPLMVALGILAA